MAKLSSALRAYNPITTKYKKNVTCKSPIQYTSFDCTGNGSGNNSERTFNPAINVNGDSVVNFKTSLMARVHKLLVKTKRKNTNRLVLQNYFLLVKNYCTFERIVRTVGHFFTDVRLGVGEQSGNDFFLDHSRFAQHAGGGQHCTTDGVHFKQRHYRSNVLVL